MIRSLRRRHRATFCVLALALPLGLSLAVLSRASVPSSAAWPRGESRLVAPSENPASDRRAQSGAGEFRLRTWKAGADGTAVVELVPSRDLELPDVLVYWADSDVSDELPLQCTLLGSLAGAEARSFRLPRGTRAESGRLYLYSLAHQRLVASLELAP